MVQLDRDYFADQTQEHQSPIAPVEVFRYEIIKWIDMARQKMLSTQDAGKGIRLVEGANPNDLLDEGWFRLLQNNNIHTVSSDIRQMTLAQQFAAQLIMTLDSYFQSRQSTIDLTKNALAELFEQIRQSVQTHTGNNRHGQLMGRASVMTTLDTATVKELQRQKMLPASFGAYEQADALVENIAREIKPISTVLEERLAKDIPAYPWDAGKVK